MIEEKQSERQIFIRRNRNMIFSFLIGMLMSIITIDVLNPFSDYIEPIFWITVPQVSISIVLGIVFGIPAAFGSVAGNIIVRCILGEDVVFILIRSAQWLVLCIVSYIMWQKMNGGRNYDEFRLDRVSRVLKFCLAAVVVSVLCIIFNIAASDYLSFSTYPWLYGFGCYFDYGVMTGIILLPIAYRLRRKLGMSEKTEPFIYHTNEKVIFFIVVIGVFLAALAGVFIYYSYILDEAITQDWWFTIIYFQRVALRLFLLITVVFVWMLERRFTRPIDRLISITGKYYDESVDDKIREEMLEDYKLLAADDTDVGKLAAAYVRMTDNLKIYIEDVKRITTEKGRIDAELNLASEIQAQMLPRVFPEHDEFDLYTSMTPAKEVGGDFYDFFMIGERYLAVVIADVSGKGVPAAMFMALAKALIKSHAKMYMDVHEVFKAVNRALCEGNDAGLFVTAWLGVLDLNDGKLSYVNAGHNPPLIQKENGEFEYLKMRPGFILAGMENTVYRKHEMYLKPGDRLFLYTDGVTEATNASEELYGEERLQTFLNTNRGLTPYEMIHGLRANIDAFVGEAPQFDDITMLMLDYNKYAKEKRIAEREFAANVGELREVLGFVEAELRMASCSTGLIMQIAMAIEEMFSNVASYAYPGKSGKVKICIDSDGRWVKSGQDNSDAAVIIRMIDRGIPFDPLTYEMTDIQSLMNEKETKGMGILLVKKLMDHITCSRENDENILTMIKIKK